MAAGVLLRRFGRIGAIAIIAFALLGFWLLRPSPTENSLPSVPITTGPRPSITLRQGTFLGIEAIAGFPQTLEEFLGIPYGQSTAGERRFREPLPVNSSTGTFDASNYGPRCPAGAADGIPMSEDCLNLNIYRPKGRPIGKKLPVLVHIYGGSFNFGFGNSRQISNLVAWSVEPFIGISFNYRVGALGFLPSSLTAKEGLLNAGLKDQALLLEWVQENIVDFGGDPNDVTLMGSSAGAHSIGHHIMHNTDETPKFHKAIIESGAATSRAVYTPSNPLHEKQFLDFLTLLGLSDSHAEKTIEALRYLPSDSIKKASETVFDYYNPSLRWPFQPVIDGPGNFISEPPIDAWQKGRWHKIPILTGFNTNEGAMFVPPSMKTGKQFTNFFRTLLPGLGESDLKQLNGVYPNPVTHPGSQYRETRKGFGAQYRRIEQAYGHFAYVAPVRQTVHFASAGPAPVYLYHFDVSSSVKGGADHGSHAAFVTYDKEIREFSETIHEVAGSMHAYWTSFITTGDPNRVKGRFPDRPFWPAYVPGKGKKVVFGEGNDEIAGGGHVGTAVQIAEDTWVEQECEFWWERTKFSEL